MIQCTRRENQATAQQAFGFLRDSDKIFSQRSCADLSAAMVWILELAYEEIPSDYAAGIWFSPR